MKICESAKSMCAGYATYAEYAKKQVAILRKNQKAITTTIDLLDRRFAGIDVDGVYMWPDVNVATGMVSLEAGITVVADSMTTGVVMQILKAMLDMECEPVSTADNVTVTDATREYRFTRPATDRYLKLSLKVSVAIHESATATCRKVQTGTTMVEVPQFKLECQGE